MTKRTTCTHVGHLSPLGHMNKVFMRFVGHKFFKLPATGIKPLILGIHGQRSIHSTMGDSKQLSYSYSLVLGAIPVLFQLLSVC